MPTAPVALPGGSMIRARFTRGRRQPSDPAEEPSVLEIEPGELARLFVAPPWLRDAGVVAWLLVGIVLVLVGAVWLLALTNTIVRSEERRVGKSGGLGGAGSGTRACLER